MRLFSSFRDHQFPVRIVSFDRFGLPGPRSECQLEMRVFILLPGVEATGIAKGFCRKQSEGERNRNASARFELERDVRQLFTVRRGETVATDVDSTENLVYT